MTPGRGVLYVASATGLALLARSLLLAPLPLWIALLAFATYGAIVLAGVLIPQLEMYAPVVWRGPRESASVALTFDDGPHPQHTLRVLDILDDYGAKATFFVLGSKADKHPQIITQIASRGHEIGVHGYDHDRFSSLRTAARIEADVARAIATVERITGVRPTLYRPPVGHVSPRTDTAATRLGVDIVAWSVRGRDGVAGARPAQVAARVIRGLKPGAIVLLHDAAEHDDRVPASIEALPAILRAAASQGLSFTPAGDFVRQRFGGGI